MIRKKYLLFLFSTLFWGCTGFKIVPKNLLKIDRINVYELNGEYSIFANGKLGTDYPYFSNANEKFYRKAGRGERDTISFDTVSNGKFKINVLDDKKINFEFIKNEEVVKSQVFKYKLKTNGFLYIKNRNTIFTGIPYLFGGVDIRKVRVALNDSKDLIINDIFNSSGAVLFIFGDAKNWEVTNTYKRVE